MFRRLNDSSMKFIDKHKEFSRKPKVCQIKFQVFEELPLLVIYFLITYCSLPHIDVLLEHGLFKKSTHSLLATS